jgi:signal transduction histidine kinase
VHSKRHDDYQAWLWGELLLFGLLGAGLALFAAYPQISHAYDLPALRLVIDTAIALAAVLVAVLAGIRFTVERRLLDLLLSCGFFVAAASGFLFALAPVLGGDALQRPEAWAGVAGRVLATGLIAAAPFLRGRVATARPLLERSLVGLLLLLLVVWAATTSLGAMLPELTPHRDARDLPASLMAVLSVQALLHLLALVGFGWRYRNGGSDLYRWLASAATLMLFSSLHLLFSPLRTASEVSQADFLRMLAYGVLLVGVWRAIRFAEFGRAVAEERARVAREVHDGLAQYLFAIATHASMLEGNGARQETIDRLKDAIAQAQQEARFAVLALSSAGGTAPFDAALRRYVDFLTADGTLDVDVEIDRRVRLAPDEQIEVFRIVQEGLANVRKHAGAKRATVSVGEQEGRRVVSVVDDGTGFEAERDGAGQGLRNIRDRAASIRGEARVLSRPGHGTRVDVALRA